MFGSDALRRRAPLNANRQIAAFLIARGDAARDARDWSRAAVWYEEALRLAPSRGEIHVQHGHMLKEAGATQAAEQAYLAAQRLMPDDADLALQLGHFYKKVGRLAAARDAYQRAITLKPRWEEAQNELAALPKTSAATMEIPATDLYLAEAAQALADSSKSVRLVPALQPRPEGALLRDYNECVEVRQMGRHERGAWGVKRTVRGVATIRGFGISRTPVAEVQLLLDGRLFHRGSVRGPYALMQERHPHGLNKYVFNLWYDFANLPAGRHMFELRLLDAEGEARSFHDDIVIASPLREVDFPDSDALVEERSADPTLLEQRIRARASMVRSARRELLPRAVANMLVLRTDQLGDMVASVPAMRRLRELFPEARIVGLLTGANAGFAESLSVFDEVIVVDFPDDDMERRRIMPLDAQQALRDRLQPYAFDLAIDLAQAGVSRELLQLSGAPFLYGVEGSDFHWLSADFALNTRDPVNRLDVVPHSRKTMALVETLGAIVQDSFRTERRDDLDRKRLQRFGISAADRYIVLHMGARVAFSRWTGFPELAALLIERTDLKVVMMTEDRNVRPALAPQLVASAKFQLLEERLEYDDFDTIVSFADVLVGNDSGPKHLASFRGIKTVTLHTARINWSTWGHEGDGVILSRRVPCAGCDIFYDSEDCGKDFACIRDISAEEVFKAVRLYV
ncbi:glycosyltransferase family 9 protein [Sphingomonas sp. ASY06-1R]|uniref:glycosyltransferase family 9 protein n=1 Tax=Sphingomonas sp. ASY06-1R TaxID=3445771 RepID=UPI003FA32523